MEIRRYVVDSTSEMYALHRELCLIPAPSHREERRAAFILDWFGKNLGEGAYIDEAKNVIYPYKTEGSNDIVVICAHTDTVFPDLEYPMPYSDDGICIRSPGVGDDTASLAALLMVAKYVVENALPTDHGILFVANSCEEGLGNLKGTRQLMNDFSGRIARFVSFDAKIGSVCNRSVGSHRYRVSVKTEGGHSFSAFGNKNAIAELSSIIGDIYSIELAKKEGARLTYNVGEISGGTSVNTIAEDASMLCEYRSDDKELLDYMRGEFARIFSSHASDDVRVEVELVGERPCMSGVDEREEKALSDLAAEVYARCGYEAKFTKGSTDCNIPHSMGIPAIAVGTYMGGGAHTRDEWVKKDSMPIGLEFAIALTEELLK